MERDTLCVHGESAADHPLGAATLPIFQTTTFRLESEAIEAKASSRARDFLLYTRYSNPTQRELERHLAALEGTESALLLSSGMAAITHSVLAMTEPGDHVVAPIGSYGTTIDFLRRLLPQFGRQFGAAEDTSPDAIRAALNDRTRLVMTESLSNPINRVADIPALAELAHEHQARLLVDATFASPYLQRPCELGADLVVHSASKYLNGHSDVIAGVVAGRAEHVDPVWELMRVLGACIDPHAAYLLERGVRTLHLRMERICHNAERVARFLSSREEVLQTHYPGLPQHADHEFARRLLPRGCGGIVSFVLQGGDEAALRFCSQLELILEATSLGGVESLASLPFNTSHARFSAAEREAIGIPPGTVRLAIGVESVEDLLPDLERALESSAPTLN